MTKILTFIKSTLSFFLLILLTNCISVEKNTGYNFDDETLQKIENRIIPNETDKNRVVSLLGSPSLTSSLDQETWYYIGNKFKEKAFLDPELLSRYIVEIKFKDDKVVNVKQYNENDANDVAISDETTPVEGNDISLIEQLLGNIGRFDTKKAE